ncbi:MAG: hypothetical protein R3F46_01370 [bacterium]
MQGLLDPKFADFRHDFEAQIHKVGFRPFWQLVNASAVLASQLRPRVAFVALRQKMHAVPKYPLVAGRKLPQLAMCFLT